MNCNEKRCKYYNDLESNNCTIRATIGGCSKGSDLMTKIDTVAESPAAMTDSSARCDEADHVLVDMGITEYGMTAKMAFELASDIHGAAFIAAHKAGFEQGK